MPMGEEPVGRPRTKGCSGVGSKALIRSDQMLTSACELSGMKNLTNDVLRDIGRSFCFTVSDDESHFECSWM